MIKHLLTTMLLLVISLTALAQEHTVGLLSYNPSKSYDGYNMIYPHNQPNVYLLNNCGEIVHVWEDDVDFRPGNMAYLMDDGRLVKTKRLAAVTEDPIWAGGGGAIIEIRDWNNNLEWSFELNTATERLHHDIALTDDGTILAIVWELKTAEEAAQAGRDTANLLSEGELWPDKIIEIDPVADSIIWEWHVWDHLIQDFDETKDNYGDVAANPQLVDINWDTSDGEADWMHSNSIDYIKNDALMLDQIVISVPTFNEFWIIDHTTTTEEAAGHFGGFSNRGGDLLCRWGNPAAYKSGTADDQKLFYQHDVHWVDDFVDVTNPYFGKIAIYNNRVGEDFSRVNIITPGWDGYKASYSMDEGVFLPNDFLLDFGHPVDPTLMHSTGLSSVQVLPNGNILTCVGRYGYSFEMTPDNEIVWEYKTPLISGAQATQGDSLEVNNNLTFRMFRYPATYSAFDGQDLASQGYLELNPDEAFCDQILPTSQAGMKYDLKIFPNPATQMVVIEWEAGMHTDVRIFDMLGREKAYFNETGGRKYLDISNWVNGIYFVQIDGRVLRNLVVTD